MKFIKNTILISLASFAFLTLNARAASFGFNPISFNGWGGYWSKEFTKKNYTQQSLETLRADHEIVVYLHESLYNVRGAKVATLYIAKKSDDNTWKKQFFTNSSKPEGYKLNFVKNSVIGSTSYWGLYQYDM